MLFRRKKMEERPVAKMAVRNQKKEKRCARKYMQDNDKKNTMTEMEKKKEKTGKEEI